VREPYSQLENGTSDPRFLRPLDMFMDIWERPNCEPISSLKTEEMGDSKATIADAQGTWRKVTSYLEPPDRCELRIM
jgi:hypothetical protein